MDINYYEPLFQARDPHKNFLLVFVFFDICRLLLISVYLLSDKLQVVFLLNYSRELVILMVQLTFLIKQTGINLLTIFYLK